MTAVAVTKQNMRSFHMILSKRACKHIGQSIAPVEEC